MSDSDQNGRSGPPRNRGPRGGPAKGGASKGGFAKGGGNRGGFGKSDKRPQGDKPFRKEGGAKPFRPRPPQGEERGERPAGGFKPRFARSSERSGEEGHRAKPYAARREDGAAGERSFKPRRDEGEARGSGERGARPFRRENGATNEDRRPRAVAREGDGERPRGDKRFERPRGERPDREAGDRPRPERAERRDAKPFNRRDDDRREGSGSETGERRDKREFVPRSRGMFGAPGGARGGKVERPRSFGRLSHDESGDGRRPRPLGDRDRAPRGDRRPARPAEGEAADGSMRIAKRLARAGIASRRDAEGMIADGRVTLNGKLVDSPAVDVTLRDTITIDGRPLPPIERTRLWLFHKPAGRVTTNRDPEGRPTVFDDLPSEMPRVLTVGRLDINTEGLLLLTNDGGLARVLELPATGWLRRYRVRAHGEVSQEQLDALRQGIAVDGVFYGAIEASLDRTQGSNVWLTLGLREGKNREVKRVLGHLGLEVNRLIRLSYGPFQLGELEEGAVQEINGRTLREQLGPTLIEEAGADFDAPIVNPFSNKPVAAERRAAPAEDGASRSRDASARDGKPKDAKPKDDWVSTSTTAPNRKRFGAEKRSSALGRLDTRPRRDGEERGERSGRSFGDKPFGKKPFGAKPFGARSTGDRPPRREDGERPPRRFEGGADAADGKPKRDPHAPRRSANVWMAPGARATGEKRRAERESDGERPHFEGPRSKAPRSEAPRSGRPGSDKPRRGPPTGGRPRGGDRS